MLVTTHTPRTPYILYIAYTFKVGYLVHQYCHDLNGWMIGRLYLLLPHINMIVGKKGLMDGLRANVTALHLNSVKPCPRSYCEDIKRVLQQYSILAIRGRHNTECVVQQ